MLTGKASLRILYHSVLKSLLLRSIQRLATAIVNNHAKGLARCMRTCVCVCVCVVCRCYVSALIGPSSLSSLKWLKCTNISNSEREDIVSTHQRGGGDMSVFGQVF